MPLDLNLLRVILAVHDAGSVAGAADALDMSQPGLSTALQRARQALNDPLFVRGHKSMEPTARTKAMVESIRNVLSTVERDVINVVDFEPFAYAGEFRLALTDVGEATLMPLILRVLELKCPKARVHTINGSVSEIDSAMENGTLDLALGYFPDLTTANYYEQLVATNSFCVLACVDHPIPGDTISLEQYLDYGHVVALAPSRSQEVIDEYLRRQKIERRLVLTTPHLMSIPAIVAQSKLLATVPEGVAYSPTRMVNPKILRPTFETPRFQSKIFWHRTAHKDSRNRWLRRTLLAELSSFPWGTLGAKD